MTYANCTSFILFCPLLKLHLGNDNDAISTTVRRGNGQTFRVYIQRGRGLIGFDSPMRSACLMNSRPLGN